MNYATLNINKKITGMLAVAAFFEWLVAGIVIGLVYTFLPFGSKAVRRRLPSPRCRDSPSSWSSKTASRKR